MSPNRGVQRLLAVAALAAVLAAQQPAAPLPQKPVTVAGSNDYELYAAFSPVKADGDFEATTFAGGFRLVMPRLQLEIHGQSGLILADRDESLDQGKDGRDDGPLPRRRAAVVEPRRRLTPEVLHARLETLLRAAGEDTAPTPAPGTRADLGARLLRYLYFEGDVVVLRSGVEVARARRLWISPLDDRMVLEGAELRYLTTDKRGGTRVLTLRGAHVEKQGQRWYGRDLELTSCTAGESHVGMLEGEVEILEHDDNFEVFTRAGHLQFSGTSVMPLPDSHFFSDDQSEFPIKGASAGYSSKEGFKTQLDVGMPWNDTGGALHEWLTGRPASEFRGDWLLGLGWTENRGYPVDGAVTYGAKGLYEGRTEAFWLDDAGNNIHEITNDIDGSNLDAMQRSLIRTQNRVRFGDATHLDLRAFHASDPSVYSEFFQGDYHTRQLPETGAYFTHGFDNKLFTVNGRFNLDEFSYRDDRGLAPRFIEEEPVATFHWLSQPIGNTPFDTPIVLDAATEIGQRRSDYADKVGFRNSDRTLRVDQVVELSTPFHYGPLNIRPFVQSRLTWYDTTVNGGSDDRLAWTAGVAVGTRMAQTWTWDANGETQGVRHVIAPLVTFEDRFSVDKPPSDFNQFDDVDALTEQNHVRAGVRNLFEKMEKTKDGPVPHDFFFLDLEQNFWPNAGRDNGGQTLGLFEYDMLIRPRAYWIPLQTFWYAIEGEHDWEKGLRTFNTELRAGEILGFTWTAEFRRDSVVKGAVGLGASTHMFDRWDLVGGSQYDLDTSAFLNYSVMLMRQDHDWTIQVGFNYDTFTNVTSFKIDFIPRLGGLMQPRDRSFFGGQRLYGPGGATDY